MKEWSEAEIREQLARYNSGEDEPPYQGAIPDVDKLQSSIQTDPYDLWWRMAKCDICVYEATIFSDGVYYCSPHWSLFTVKMRKPE